MLNITFGVVYAADLSTEYAFGGVKSLGEGVSYLVVPAFGIATTAVAFYFIMGAFKFLTSGSNKDSIASGRNMIIHAVIGFLMLMMLFLVLQYLPEAIGLSGFKIIQ